MSETVFVGRGFLEALVAMRKVLQLDYDIRDVVCGISLNLFKTGTLYRANHRITPSDEFPPNTIARVSWCNGFHFEFSPAAVLQLRLSVIQVGEEQLFWTRQT